jgi:nascent polypeptide-associated complex subunit alpha
MFPGINPKKMQSVMKQMGISQEEINASKVTIEKEDGSKIIIKNPSIIKIKMQGEENFQISGEITESEISEEDIKQIIEKTGCSEEKARETLEKTKDLAEAIIELS